jgi:hypothetical protein
MFRDDSWMRERYLEQQRDWTLELGLLLRQLPNYPEEEGRVAEVRIGASARGRGSPPWVPARPPAWALALLPLLPRLAPDEASPVCLAPTPHPPPKPSPRSCAAWA